MKVKTKKEKEIIKEDAYKKFMEACGLFNNLEISGCTYRDRLMNKYYSASQYYSTTKLLLILHKKFYTYGDRVVLDILFKSNRIQNKETRTTIMFGCKGGTVDVWDGDISLEYSSAVNYKIGDIL